MDTCIYMCTECVLYRTCSDGCMRVSSFRKYIHTHTHTHMYTHTHTYICIYIYDCTACVDDKSCVYDSFVIISGGYA